MLELLAQLCRLAILAAFVALAIEDIRTRSCPVWVWYPIVGVAILALLADAISSAGTPAFDWLAIRLAVGLLALGIIAALLWVSPAGNADAKAILALALAFPTPAVWAPAIPFALTIFLNTMVLAVPATLVLAACGRLERGVPFLAYVAAGLLVGLFVGDLVLLIAG